MMTMNHGQDRGIIEINLRLKMNKNETRSMFYTWWVWIKDIVFKHPILYAFAFIISFIFVVTASGEPIFEYFLLVLLSILSIPSILVGILVSRSNAPKVGLGFGFSYLTILILIQPGEESISGLLRAIPFTFLLGIVITIFGSIIGDGLRLLTNKKNLTVKTRIAFLLNYIYPLLILFYAHFYEITI